MFTECYASYPGEDSVNANLDVVSPVSMDQCLHRCADAPSCIGGEMSCSGQQSDMDMYRTGPSLANLHGGWAKPTNSPLGDM